MQEPERMTPPERGGKDMEERIRHFEAKRREKLLQALQLDEATRTRLTQRLEQLDQKAQDLRRQRQEAVQALREQAKGLRKEIRRGQRNGGGRGPEGTPPAGGSPADNSSLRQTLERVYAVEDAMTGLRRERLQVARDLLTPEQQVKFLLFTVRFQKEMHERLLREQGGQEGGRR
jgi:small-conductance mechanosensitive channel